MSKLSAVMLVIVALIFGVSCTTVTTANRVAAKDNAKLGMLYLQNKNSVRAKEKLLLALQENPRDAMALGAFGYYLEHSGQSKLAGEYYHRAVLLNPHNGAAQNNYGVYLCRHGSPQLGRRYLLAAAHNLSYLHADIALRNANECPLLHI